MSIQIRLPLAPSANRYWRKTRQGRVYVSPEAMAFRGEVAAAFKYPQEPLEGDVIVYIDAYICDRRRDTDSVVKQTLDAMQGLAFEDDNQVTEIHVYRYKAKTRKLAHMDVFVTPLGEDE